MEQLELVVVVVVEQWLRKEFKKKNVLLFVLNPERQKNCNCFKFHLPNKAFAAACGTANPAPSANLNINCNRPVAPKSMPERSISSVSNEVLVFTSNRSVTFPTFIGRPANSKPFNCSRAFFASSAL